MVLELSSAGEARAKEGCITKLLMTELGSPNNVEIFIPIQTYTKADRIDRIDGMQGYIFISTGLADHQYFDLERTDWVRTVMAVRGKGLKTLACVPNSSVEEIRQSIRREVSDDLQEGMVVRVRTGLFSYLEGTVIDRVKDEIILEISMRSLHAIVRVNGLCVDPVGVD